MPVLVGGCLAAALLAWGVPRLVAATAMLQGEPALELFRSGARPTAAGVERAIQSRLVASRWAPSGRPHLEIGTVLVALAGEAGTDGLPAEGLLTRAAAELRRGLALKPADAPGWQQLAAASLALGDADDAAAALRMSYRADPHTPQLDPARTMLAAALWERLEDGWRALAHREMRTSFRQDPRGAIETALRTGSLDRLREAVATDEQDAQGLALLLDEYRAAGT